MKCKYCGEEIEFFTSEFHACPEKLAKQRFWAKVLRWGVIILVLGMTLEGYQNFIADTHSTSIFGFFGSEIYRFAMLGVVLVGGAVVGWVCILLWCALCELWRYLSNRDGNHKKMSPHRSQIFSPGPSE